MRGGHTDDKTGKAFLNYEMAAIREHKAIIKQVEVSGNLVISLDEDGYINLAFISFEDPEEYKAYKIEEFASRNVVCFHYEPESATLLVVENDKANGMGFALYALAIDEEKETVKVDRTVYSTKIELIDDPGVIINVFGDNIIISPDFRTQNPEEGSNKIFIVSRRSGEISKLVSYTHWL